MTRKYWGAAGVFVASLAALAAIAGAFVARLDPLQLVVALCSAYGAAVLLDALPPGRPGGREHMPDPEARTQGRRAAPASDRRDPVQLASAGALAGISVVMGVAIVVTAWQGTGAEAAGPYAGESAEQAVATGDGDDADAAPPDEDVASPTATPRATATPTTEATATPAPVPTPEVPDSAFAYCTHLEGSNYSCGDQPWRVICTPDGQYYFDPEGEVPRPIPEEWEGWHETTLTDRLEYIHGACD